MPKPSRLVALLLLLPLALAWQVSAWGVLPVFGWQLDFPLVLVMACGLLFGPRAGLLFGLLAGGLQDLLLGAGLLYGLTKGLAGLAVGLIQPHVMKLDALSLAVVAIVTTLAEGLLVALSLLAQGRTGVWDHFAALALPLGAAHALLLLVAYGALRRLGGPEREERPWFVGMGGSRGA